MPHILQTATLGAPYKRKCGNTTFIISSFGNPNAKNTAEDLILQILENRIRETSLEQNSASGIIKPNKKQ